jgi:signal transduction histidine kinase
MGNILHKSSTLLNNVEQSFITLSFGDNCLEQEYRREYLHRSVKPIRKIYGAGIVFFMFQCFHEIFVGGSLSVFFGYGAILPVLITGLLLSYRFNAQKYLYPTGIVAIAILCYGNVFLRNPFEPVYYISTFVLIIFTVFTVGRIYLKFSLYAGLAVTLFFCFAQILYFQSTFQEFTFYLMPVLFSLVTGYISGRTIENHLRREFLLSKEWMTLNNTLDEANTVKTEFLAIAAHDLNNPLSGVLGLTQVLMEDSSLASDVRRKIELINKSTSRMKSIVSQLLDVAAVESGGQSTHFSRVNLSSLTIDISQNHIPSALRKKQLITVNVDENVEIIGDGDKLKSIIDNLLSNAIKYTPLDKSISVELKRNCEYVHLSVHDQGPGINDHDFPKLFSRWQRLSAKPTGGESSTGLGLSIVKQFVELHGGKISVENNPEGGAVFTVSLPMIIDQLN